MRRVGDFAERLATRDGRNAGAGEAADAAVADVEAALFDDLNAPNALARSVHVHHAGERRARPAGSATRSRSRRARAAFARINGVLDIVPDRTVDDPELVAWVEERLAARRAARERRDFAEADRIRAELTERGDGDRGRGRAARSGSRLRLAAIGRVRVAKPLTRARLDTVSAVTYPTSLAQNVAVC